MPVTYRKCDWCEQYIKVDPTEVVLVRFEANIDDNHNAFTFLRVCQACLPLLAQEGNIYNQKGEQLSC